MASEDKRAVELTEAERQRIERFRQTGLRLDRHGRWWHEGEIVQHRGLVRAINRWLDRLDDGRYIIRLDEHRYAYVDVEDTPYIVVTVTHSDDGRLWIHLSDGEREELDYESLAVGSDHALYCRCKDRRFASRFSHQAHQLLVDAIEQLDDGRFALRAAGKSWPIAER